MKKIMNILMLCAVLVAFTSCKDEVDDVFDQTASERIDTALKSYNEILKSAPNGWIMYYYGATTYGGYNVVVKFHDDATATVANERIARANGGELTFPTERSHYKLVQSSGVVLSFDEYNRVFHYYSDPLNPDGIGTAGTGFDGDLEFRVISASNELIELSGKKTNRRIYMVPMPIDMTWDTYLNKIKTIESDMACANVVVTINKTDSIATTTNSPYRRFTFTLVDENGVVTTKSAPYIVTLEGYKFYTSVDLKGKKVEQFNYVPSSVTYPEASDNTVELNCIIPPINKQLVSSVWYFKGDGMSDSNYALWRAYNEAGVKQFPTYGYLRDVAIGQYSSYGNIPANFGLTAHTQYYQHYRFEYELIDDDKIRIPIVSTFAGLNGAYFLQYLGSTLAPCIGLFTELHYTPSNGKIVATGGTKVGEPHTFTLETDYLKAPTYIKMTRDDGEVFIVTPTVNSYPFGQGN